MQNDSPHTTLFDVLEQLLKENGLYLDNAGNVVKNMVLQDALNLKPELLRVLLACLPLRERFFAEVEGMLVFDKVEFGNFINLKNFLKDSYTRYKDRIGLGTEGDTTDYLSSRKEVVLNFPYKDCVLQGGQTKEDARKNEVFWNMTLAPDQIDRLLDEKVLTKWKRIEAEPIYETNPDLMGERKTIGYKAVGKPIGELRSDDNFIIKGNNLMALHCLRARYEGKVKLIYIDPPYNTGNDSFLYNDRFNHSTWLVFMKNRLEIARKLLSKEGAILIQIDNKEEAYLKILCDEIFGRDCYKNSIVVRKGQKNLQKQFDKIKQLNAGFDTILLYTKKNITLPNLFKFLEGEKESSWNNHWRGTDRPTMRYELFGIEPEAGQWRWSEERTMKAVRNYEVLIHYIKKQSDSIDITDMVIDEYYLMYIQENEILQYSDFELVRLSRNGKPEHYIPPSSKIILSENWLDLTIAGKETSFLHEKNEEILFRILDWLTEPNDIILDFFSGSGTSLAVAHKMGRQYIGIEQMDYVEDIPFIRMEKVVAGEQGGISKAVEWKGGGGFVYCELMQCNQKYVGKIENAQTDAELVALRKELINSKFLNHLYQKDSLAEEATLFEGLSFSDKKRFLLELLDLNQLYVNRDEAKDASLQVSAEDAKLTEQFYKTF